MRRFGVPSAACVVAILLAAAACGVRYGFAGGGLPAHIRTMAVLPFENETASPEVQRELQITIDITIVDQSTGRPLWERRGLRAEGEYAEREEAAGRRSALQKIVSDIVEGAQSQW